MTSAVLLLLTTLVASSAPANAASAPGRPTNVVGSALDAAVSLTWKAPISTGGSSITGYRVRRSSNNGSTWSSSTSTGSKSTAFTVTGLKNGTQYVFQVRAANRVGSGSWSSTSAAVTPVAATEPPAVPDPPVVPEPPAVPSGTWWAPTKGTTWQWQLTGNIDTTVNAAVFDVDGEDASAATVSTLHSKGAKVICYFSAGSYENWRSDASSFPSAVRGQGLDGWAGESWLDVRRLDVLLPIMEKRIANCKAKGFDAVEPDNVDGYSNSTGFPLTSTDQATYNKALADLAHRYGLGIALKNDPDQVKALEPYFDFSVAEECARYNECNAYAPFTAAGKAVLHVEYSGTLASFCPTTKALGFSSQLKKLDLDAWRSPCP